MWLLSKFTLCLLLVSLVTFLLGSVHGEHELDFTVDFFKVHIDSWTFLHKEIKRTVLLRHAIAAFNDDVDILDIDTDIPLNYLEVGSFEGRSTTWMLENVLQHPDSRITCIDTWEGSTDFIDFFPVFPVDIFERFLLNIAPYKSKVSTYQGRSNVMLKDPKVLVQKFDFIYIDAGHTSVNALEDAVLAYPLLKVGGVMTFDDYLWQDGVESLHALLKPKKGIDAFLEIYSGTYQVVQSKYQVIIQKLADEMATS